MNKRYSFLGVLILGWFFIIEGTLNTVTSVKNISSPFDLVSTEGEVDAGDAVGFVPYIAPIEEDLDQLGDASNWEMVSKTSQDLGDTEHKNEFVPDNEILHSLDDIQTEDHETEEFSIPRRLVIDSIDLDTPVIPVNYREIEYKDNTYQQWLAPDESVSGWHSSSADLGKQGNTVLNGHHNVYGEVFRNLHEVKSGDYINVFSQTKQFTYVVSNTLLLEERFQPVETRMDNARWIQATSDERLTLVTCWPYESNTHRVVVVAIPVEVVDLGVEVMQEAD